MQVLITSHFAGGCSFCDELLLTSRGPARSRVGQIEVMEPESRRTMCFFVFQDNGQWCFTTTPPKEQGMLCCMQLSVVYR